MTWRNEVMLMIRDFSTMFQQMSGMPINSKSGKQLLRQAGIDTNSKQYKAAINQMNASCKGVGYTNPQAIKNIMSNFDKDGDRLNAFGVAGMDATGIPQSQRHKIIKVSESARQDMFETTKREFLRDNGELDADKTQRSEVFRRYQLSVPKSDRLKGTWTLGEYERAYRQAFADACKQADSSWKPGKDIPSGALDGITRESIDNSLVKSNGQFGETLVRKSVDYLV